MDSASRREARVVTAGISIFVVSMLVIFALVARVALYQLNRIYAELEEFTETEVSLTRIVTRVQQRQSEQLLALERGLRQHATGSDADGKLLEEAIAVFRTHGDEIERDVGKGIEIVRTAGAISSPASDEYSHMEELLRALQRDHSEFDALAGELIETIRSDPRADIAALLEGVERESRDTGRHAESLLLELGSFMEETGWQVEIHGQRAIQTIGLVAVLGALGVVVFGAYVLFSTLSHMRKRRRVEEALRSSEARHQADLSTLQDSAGELATLATEAEIRRYLEQQLTQALALEWAEVRLGTEPGDVGAASERISFGGELLGTIGCGPKSSGAPLSAAERRLLKSVAEQAAVALHNARTIQALRRANESLLRNARLVAVGEFAGAVAHGIRNPLSGIRAAAQAAHKKAGPGPSADVLARIMGEADRLDHRIRGLLDFSRPHELSLRKIDLRELLESVALSVTQLPESNGKHVIPEVPRDRVEREVDPDYLEDALLELAVNALRAMPEGGELRLRLERDAGGTSLSVEDTGAGIPKGVRDRVFDLFFTTRPDGTGLGLATVKRIIEAHGWTLELERTGDDGTLFRIELGPAV